MGGVSGCWGSGRGCSERGGVAAGIGMAAWLVVSGTGVGAVSGSGPLTGPSVVWSFWSSVMSAVLRLSPGGPGSPRLPLDTARSVRQVRETYDRDKCCLWRPERRRNPASGLRGSSLRRGRVLCVGGPNPMHGRLGGSTLGPTTDHWGAHGHRDLRRRQSPDGDARLAGRPSQTRACGTDWARWASRERVPGRPS